MKINYDVILFKEIANHQVNDIVKVVNSKHVRTTLHIQNITKLSWNHLQLLISGGDDRFSKMVILYEFYKDGGVKTDVIKGERYSKSECDEIKAYIDIYKANSFLEHHEVNSYITANQMWEMFPTLRSMNDHGHGKIVPGIQPKYFRSVCNILNITSDLGSPLESFSVY